MHSDHFKPERHTGVGDVLAGALLLNTIPHAIMGLAGKRCMTPLGGANSSPAANLAWAVVNLTAGTAALRPASWRATDQPTADARLRNVTMGIVAMAAFAAAYELSPTATERRRMRARCART
jgi:hypothetical protein